MSPTAELLVPESEVPFGVVDPSGATRCPHCKKNISVEWVTDQRNRKGRPVSKEVTHYLLLPKQWLKGVTGSGKDEFGGYHGASEEQNRRWYAERRKGLKLIEVRGQVPAELEHTNAGRRSGGSAEDGEPSGWSGAIVCGKCGRAQEPLKAIKVSGRQGPIFPYLIQGYDPQAKEAGFPYGGRFFAIPDFEQIMAATNEFSQRDDLRAYVPNEEVPFGFLTHVLQGGIPNHGFTHWYKMFNDRQLYVNAALLSAIDSAPAEKFSDQVKSHVFGAFQNYLRHNCMFTIWDRSYDKMTPHFSNNNYAPKATFVENAVFADMGRGNFLSCVGNVLDGLNYMKEPYELKKADENAAQKSEKIPSEDRINPERVRLYCQSSTDLRSVLKDQSIDLVITDPPFGINVNYAEMADFFLAWLRKPLAKLYPEIFVSSESPKALEAVTNPARHPGTTDSERTKADEMYYRLLKGVWKEAHRILKPSGLLAFTFHHDDEQAWLDVLDSLFDSGFEIEATYPVRSDSTRGEGRGAFGSKKIEYDIVHVCRKRADHVPEVYWATLRKRILDSIVSRASLLAQHRMSGLHFADLEVVIKGEVLQQYSKHYGKVKKNLAGDLISVREILLEANSIALGLLEDQKEDRVPDSVSPLARVFFSLLREAPTIARNDASKRLKGSGITLEELQEAGWVTTIKKDGQKLVHAVDPVDRWNSLSRKSQLKSDLDQVHFAINCCIGGRVYKDKPADLESWIADNYKLLLPSVGPILKYIESNHFGSNYKQAIGIAYRTLERTLQKLKDSDGAFRAASEQMSLFGAEEN